ncbi:MAG: hypothetical protein AAGG72_05680 [Pseudomonadota bacterium]
MKAIITATVLAVSLAVSSGAYAQNQVGSPVLTDLAQDGHFFSPQGVWTGR